MIWALALFALLILVVALLRRRLLFEIQGSSLLLTGSSRPGLFIYSFIMFPGTVLHELSHWFVAEVLQVKTGEIKLIPESESRGDTRLGSVATVRTDPLRGFFIGISPFFTGLIALFLMGYFLERGWGTYAWWINALLIYGQIVISNSMLTSSSDLRYWPFIAILFTTFYLIFSALGITLSIADNSFFLTVLSQINMVLGLTISFSLAMILLLYLVRLALERATKKRVTS